MFQQLLICSFQFHHTVIELQHFRVPAENIVFVCHLHVLMDYLSVQFYVFQDIQTAVLDPSILQKAN